MALVFGDAAARETLERDRRRQKNAYIADIYRALSAIVDDEMDDVLLENMNHAVWEWAFDAREALDAVLEKEGIEL